MVSGSAAGRSVAVGPRARATVVTVMATATRPVCMGLAIGVILRPLLILTGDDLGTGIPSRAARPRRAERCPGSVRLLHSLAALRSCYGLDVLGRPWSAAVLPNPTLPQGDQGLALGILLLLLAPARLAVGRLRAARGRPA